MENRPESEKENESGAERTYPAEPVENAVSSTESEPEQVQRSKGVAAVFRDAFHRARHGQKRGTKMPPQSNPLVSDRSAQNRDRTKTLFVSVAGLVAVLVILFPSQNVWVDSGSGSRPKL